jgi:hypothetical protein
MRDVAMSRATTFVSLIALWRESRRDIRIQHDYSEVRSAPDTTTKCLVGVCTCDEIKQGHFQGTKFLTEIDYQIRTGVHITITRERNRRMTKTLRWHDGSFRKMFMNLLYYLNYEGQ